MSNQKFETLCVRAGYQPQKGQTLVTPIAASTTYKYDKADDVAALFDLAEVGHMYSRISNPTVDALEQKVAALEGGTGALAVASGQSATTLAILTICQAGEHFVALSNLYGGTYTLFVATLSKLGIEVSFVPPNATKEQLEAAIKPNTKLVFAETIGNPSLDILDIEQIATIAHDNGLPLFVDNTIASPYLCRPFEHGADIIVHSATKYLDGHATSVAGVIVDGGKFDWTSGKFPSLSEPDPSYHGIRYTETFGDTAFITKTRVGLLRDLGTALSPFNAFLVNLGTETLALRMERTSQNALTIAHFLENHHAVSWVVYPGLANSPEKARADKYLPKGASGIISFGVKGGAAAGKAFIDNMALVSLVVHLGDLRSHALHPASTTHRQLTESEQLSAGVKPDGIRLSVGIENVDDIIADLDRALSIYK